MSFSFSLSLKSSVLLATVLTFVGFAVFYGIHGIHYPLLQNAFFHLDIGLVAPAVVFGIFAGLELLYLFLIRSRIPFASEMIRASVSLLIFQCFFLNSLLVPSRLLLSRSPGCCLPFYLGSCTDFVRGDLRFISLAY